MEKLTDIPLAELTTLRLGGPARTLLRTTTRQELIDAVREADRSGEKTLIIAGGSNLVVADEGVPWAIQVATRGIERTELADGRVAVTAEAGEDWDAFVTAAVADGLVGVECLAGIPGTVGATPIQNVGAYGQEVAETITEVLALERASGEVRALTPEQCGFSYRSSRFKRTETHVVLAVTFALARDDGRGSAPIRYAELARKLGVELGERAPLAAVREAVLELRRGKGMVLDPDDPDTRSAGSFFTNPILGPDEAERLARLVAERFGDDVSPPFWPQSDGRVKVSAAWLIERAGFHRGYGDGRVGLSSKHTLAVINRGGATTAELVAFARSIAAGVYEAFGVELMPEPVFYGHSW
ncbi:MAG TPA: UDP-N-acetylmuramate dehydrogenase [Solirubrobacterales bacterium]|jgi:UDP-N-acetylmuramate dehydrogenase